MATAEVIENDTNSSRLVNNLIEKIITCKNAYFKSQQIGDADLTLDEKRNIVRDFLNQGPVYFFRRFHQCLDVCDLKYFESFKDNYEVAFYIKNIIEKNSKRGSSIVKNRRYAALQKLVKDGKYFSDHEMRKRDPKMFEQFVGQYMSRCEKEEMDLNAKREEVDLRLSSILVDRLEEENRFIEEFDSDSEDEVGDLKLNEFERKLLKEEFVTNMHQTFLEGRDNDFDYSLVDGNSDYDPLEVVQQDAEDSYFDTEEPTMGAETTEMR
ncbi:hypothetical protein CHUAL_012283 [Chamberlinius hualienensis]